MRWGLAYTSSPAKKIEIRRALSRFKKWVPDALVPNGFVKKASSSESKARPFLVSTESDRVNQLLKVLKNPQIDNILMLRGGYGSIRLLKYLDRVSLSRIAPKNIWGFSDLTTLQNYLYFKYGWSWVHSPMLTSAAFYKAEAEEKYLWDEIFLRGTEGLSFNYELRSTAEAVGKKVIQLPILGGNLSCYVAFLTTRYAPSKTDPYLLFLEDVNEVPYRVDRLLEQVSAHPLFEQCRGIVAGHFTERRKTLAVLREWAKENKRFLLESLPAGHERPNLPIPMGRIVRVQTLRGRQVSVSLSF